MLPALLSQLCSMSLCQPVKPEGTLWVNQRESSAKTPSGRGPAKGAKASREREVWKDVREEEKICLRMGVNEGRYSKQQQGKKWPESLGVKVKSHFCSGKWGRPLLSFLPLVPFLVLEMQSCREVQALCLRSALTQYHFRPVGVIAVQLTEQRKARH